MGMGIGMEKSARDASLYKPGLSVIFLKPFFNLKVNLKKTTPLYFLRGDFVKTRVKN
jgi:hypothetical protein